MRADLTKLGTQGWLLGFLLMAPVILLRAFPPHWSWRVSPNSKLGSGVLISARGDRQVFHEIVCQVGRDARGAVQGYFMRFEANEGIPQAVEAKVDKEQVSQLGGLLSEGTYAARLSALPHAKGYRTQLTLSEGWKQGNVETPYGQFHFSCAEDATAPAQPGQASPGPVREHSWFQGCTTPNSLPVWKRAWCRVRPGN